MTSHVRRVIDYIDANIVSTLRLKELASVAATSKFHFSRAFTNTVGVSPHTFVMSRRLSRATELLSRGNMAIQEIALVGGFSDHAHLTRAFKAHFGRTQSEERNQQR